MINFKMTCFFFFKYMYYQNLKKIFLSFMKQKNQLHKIRILQKRKKSIGSDIPDIGLDKGLKTHNVKDKKKYSIYIHYLVYIL